MNSVPENEETEEVDERYFENPELPHLSEEYKSGK